MIRVLIADRSSAGRVFLEQVLTDDPELQVIGAVADGGEACEFVRRERPDVVMMDTEMPGMSEYKALRRIMEAVPLPVVVVCGVSVEEQRASFGAIEAGALAVVSRPPGRGDAAFEEAARELITTVKTMAEVRVVRRWPKKRDLRGLNAIPVPPSARGARIVGMGASTGGPAVLKAILSELPREFPFPIVLVQHMSHGFMEGFVDWLRVVTNLPVQLGVDGKQVQAGCVYVAPEGSQMGVRGDGRIVLSKGQVGRAAETAPSVSWLFHSLADSYGPAAVGVLFTGMGRDGADSLRLLKERGGVTIVQSAETCVVNGMPLEALKLDAASYVLSPGGIKDLLCRLSYGR